MSKENGAVQDLPHTSVQLLNHIPSKNMGSTHRLYSVTKKKSIRQYFLLAQICTLRHTSHILWRTVKGSEHTWPRGETRQLHHPDHGVEDSRKNSCASQKSEQEHRVKTTHAVWWGDKVRCGHGRKTTEDTAEAFTGSRLLSMKSFQTKAGGAEFPGSLDNWPKTSCFGARLWRHALGSLLYKVEGYNVS